MAPEKLDAARRANPGLAVEVVDVYDEAGIAGLLSSVGPLQDLVVTSGATGRGGFLEQSVTKAHSYVDGEFWGTYALACYAASTMPATGSMLFTTGGLAVHPVRGEVAVTTACAAVEVHLPAGSAPRPTSARPRC